VPVSAISLSPSHSQRSPSRTYATYTPVTGPGVGVGVIMSWSERTAGKNVGDGAARVSAPLRVTAGEGTTRSIPISSVPQAERVDRLIKASSAYVAHRYAGLADDRRFIVASEALPIHETIWP
jgi:hypothetical protein